MSRSHDHGHNLHTVHKTLSDTSSEPSTPLLPGPWHPRLGRRQFAPLQRKVLVDLRGSVRWRREMTGSFWKGGMRIIVLGGGGGGGSRWYLRGSLGGEVEEGRLILSDCADECY